MKGLLAALLLLVGLGCSMDIALAQAQRAAASTAPIKVVYHLTAGPDEAQHAMGNIRNHLRADPSVEIVVVGNGKGIEFMLDGAKDQNGYPFDATIQQLKTQGVDFRLCANSLTARKIDKSKVVPDVTIVESGVAEVARLEAREGFAYLRP